MFQIGFSFEVQVALKTLTIATGWGFGLYANQKWWQSLFTIIRQGAGGARRYGVVLAGFFVTLQTVDILAAQKAIAKAVRR